MRSARVVIAVLLILCLLFIGPSKALADAVTCPDTISGADCASIYGTWVNWVASGAGGSCGSTALNLTGNDNEQKIFNYYIGRGLGAIQAAAIDGNYGQESHWNPSDSGGYLAQWGGGRLAALEAFAQQANLPVTDLGVQLDFSWHELTTSYKDVLTNVKNATTIEDATKQFMGPNPAPIPGYPEAVGGGYENPGVPQLQNRIAYAQDALARYGTASNGTVVTGSSACSGFVNCSSSGNVTTGLSKVRGDVVCIAKQELVLWQNPDVQKSELCKRYGAGNAPGGWCEEWCADFVSWVYEKAGYPLQPDPGWRVPGVVGIQQIGEENVSFHYHAIGGYTPRPGDIAIHLIGEQHVNIVISVSGNTLTLIGGDQGGPNYGGPNSTSSVSEYTKTGFDSDGIVGYVSPD